MAQVDVHLSEQQSYDVVPEFITPWVKYHMQLQCFSPQIIFGFMCSISSIVHPNLLKPGWCVKRSWVCTMPKFVHYTMCRPEDMKLLSTITFSQVFSRKAAKLCLYLHVIVFFKIFGTTHRILDIVQIQDLFTHQPTFD